MGRKSMSGIPCLSASGAAPAKDQTRRRIEKMEAEREERRRAMKEMRVERAEEEQRNLAQGNPGDVDFIGLVRKWREEHCGSAQPHGDPHSLDSSTDEKICVCVRKRPLNEKERRKKEHDAVSIFHPTATVHSPKLRVDGISKYLDHNSFCFDHSFDEECTTEDVYSYTAKPLVGYVCGGKGVRATVFAYGQTGSGKTHTMSGIQNMIAEDIFLTLTNNSLDDEGCSIANTRCSIAIFEIYGGRIQDLLNKRKRLKVLEDGRGEVVVAGLEEFEATNPSEFLELIETGQNNRTTHATEANDVSSRSHAICQILFRDKNSGKLKGKLSLVDLAGSERGTDTKSHNLQRRTESSEINTSLLALKECIRAIDSDSKHVPYRQSKLTLILKDCFVSKLARTAMIATLSPGSLSTDHTVNTLRYADRIKEKAVGDLTKKAKKSPLRPQAGDDNLSKSPSLNRQAAKATSPPSPDEKRDDDFDELDDIMDGDTYGEDFEEDEELSESDYDEVARNLLDKEEELLNLHMAAIQEKAELLTEEGRLLQSVERDDYDMDQYASRLGQILERKTELALSLKDQIAIVRDQLKLEEELSKKLRHKFN